MNLTWHLSNRTAPAGTWGDLMPNIAPEPPKVRNRGAKTGRKPVIGALILDAIEAGNRTPAAIEAASGLTRTQVTANLHSMAKSGQVKASGKGPGTVWCIP